MGSGALQFISLIGILPMLFLDRALAREKPADASDEIGANLALGALALLSESAIFAGFIVLYSWLQPYVTLVPPPPLPIQLAIALILGDFALYWHHRLAHRLRWLWASHVVHHQSRRIDLSAGLRNHPLAEVGTCIFWGLLLVFGVSPAVMLFAAGLIGAWVLLIHRCETGWYPAVPSPIGYILNLPAHHRMHHLEEERAGHCNFGHLFIIWDRLFATYRAPVADNKRYGVAGAAANGPIGRLLWDEWRRVLGLRPTAAAARVSLLAGVSSYICAAAALAAVAAVIYGRGS